MFLWLNSQFVNYAKHFRCLVFFNRMFLSILLFIYIIYTVSLNNMILLLKLYNFTEWWQACRIFPCYSCCYGDPIHAAVLWYITNYNCYITKSSCYYCWIIWGKHDCSQCISLMKFWLWHYPCHLTKQFWCLQFFSLLFFLWPVMSTSIRVVFKWV